MAKTQIHGGNQILDDTIVDAKIKSNAAIASTKLAAWAANRDAGTNRLTNLGDPSSPQDAATKSYVDGVAQGLDVKKSVRAATTASITLSNTQTIDGVALSAGDRVLVKNQSTGSQNGIYDVVSGGSWTRSTDADSSAEVTAGMFVFVEEGTSNADTGWVMSNDGAVTLGTTALTFTQFSTAGSITAGTGLTKTGNTLDVGANADGSITVNADDIQVARDAAGAITLGTGLKVNLDSTGGLEINSNAVRVKLNGSSLTRGSSGLSVTNPCPTFVTRETPSGSVNGSNTSFTLANTPTSGTEEVFLNGILQEPGAGNDYTISGGTITYLTAPVTGDRLRVNYRY